MGWKKIYLIFGMCDETFSINYTAEVPPDVDRGWFMFFVTLLNHFYWFFGATLGGIFGGLIHFSTEGLDFVVTAFSICGKPADAAVDCGRNGSLYAFGTDGLLKRCKEKCNG